MIIDVKDLCFSYPNHSTNAVKDLSFTIEEGEIFGFLGPSGAGKSTTQKILTGILQGYSGKVNVFGREIKKWNYQYYEKIGVGFEFPNHYEKLTALENLKFFSTFYDKKNIDLEELFRQVDLIEDIHTPVSQFSKGMKMRLNFARAMMHDPQLLFLDEPTSGLDPVNARKIKDIILEKKSEKKTVFLTTHHMGDAEELCDRVAFIVKGELRIIDSPKSLKLKESKNLLIVEYIENNQLSKREFELKNIGINQAYLELIKHVEVKSMHSKESSLEDIFIKITGESIT